VPDANRVTRTLTTPHTLTPLAEGLIGNTHSVTPRPAPRSFMSTRAVPVAVALVFASCVSDDPPGHGPTDSGTNDVAAGAGGGIGTGGTAAGGGGTRSDAGEASPDGSLPDSSDHDAASGDARSDGTSDARDGSVGECLRDCEPGYRLFESRFDAQWCVPEDDDDPRWGCGSYATGCSFTHATHACVNGACAMVACHPGYADCNPAVNGCETRLGTWQHCGACNHACAQGELCQGAACVASCPAPNLVCPGARACADFAQSALHCGGCNQTCSAPPGDRTAECVNGDCGLSAVLCAPGYEDCNGRCAPAGACDSGVCADGCRLGERCVAGACECASGLVRQQSGSRRPGYPGDCLNPERDVYGCGDAQVACDSTDGGSGGVWCDSGTCRPESTLAIATGLGAPVVRALFDGHLYFFDPVAKTIGAVRLASGDVTLLVTGRSNVNDIAVDAAHVYWAEPRSAILRVPRGGGPIAEFASAEGVGFGPEMGFVEVGKDHVYWDRPMTEFNDQGTVYPEIVRANKTGGPASVASRRWGEIDMYLGDLALDASENVRGTLCDENGECYPNIPENTPFTLHIEWTPWSYADWDFATDGTLRYYEEESEEFYRFSPCGNYRTYLAAGVTVRGMVVDDTYVYFGSDGYIGRIPK
jgi:hypothetical protein